MDFHDFSPFLNNQRHQQCDNDYNRIEGGNAFDYRIDYHAETKRIAMIAHDNKKPHCLNGPATIELHHFVAANGRLI